MFSHVGVILAVSVVLGVLVAGLSIPAVALLGMGAQETARTMKQLPEELRTDPLAQRTRVLSAGGKVIATFYDENRVNVPLDQIAPIMREAIVAIEDYRFYQHGALDMKGTLRAFLTNQTSDSVQGGSSITQQLAKITQVAQAQTKEEVLKATENTLARKIQELRHAIALEQTYSKDWILNRYLNTAYFGNGAYGIQAASQAYFSVDAKKLTTAQAATLAGLVKNPTGFDPTRNPERAKARRDVVLARMGELGVITPERADKLAATKLRLKEKPNRNGCLGTDAAFFCDYVRRYLLADPSLGKTVEDREKLLNAGGLTIKTTLRPKFQRAADGATSRTVFPKEQAIGALAMVQPGTGEVFAISQSRPMGRDKRKGQTFLNYVVNQKYGDSNGFQAGSTFKLFVLAQALEDGIDPGTRISSPYSMSIPQNSFDSCDGPYNAYGPWNVSNSTGSGTFNLYTGTQQSVNTFFAQLEQRTGLCEPFELAKKMGISLPYPEGDEDHAPQRVPTFVLGVADVSPLEMAGAYATFAARGEHCEPRPVTSILNSEGKLFKRYPKDCEQVISEDTADTINDILRGVMEGGFGSGLQLSGRVSAGKTGTTQSNRAVWFNGYTPTLSTAAMVAGANAQGQPQSLRGQVIGGYARSTAFGST
ncbi:MAG: glycosyl transferase, partial [Myxococcales bacterium]